MKISRRTARAGCALCLLTVAALAGDALAQVNGVITTQPDGRKLTGQLKWRAREKTYEIGAAGLGVITIPLDKVANVKVLQPPTSLDGLIKIAQTGSPGSAIPGLEQIVQTYDMLEFDLLAAPWLARAYLKTGKLADALRVCDQARQFRPRSALSADFLQVYWEALLANRRDSELEKQLTAAAAEGSREVAAIAQNKRGDMQMERREYKTALVDGYLRTVVLFADIRTVQPEALFKAAQCFDQLGQAVYAEKMRKKLLADFPQSSYSEKLKSGG